MQSINHSMHLVSEGITANMICITERSEDGARDDTVLYRGNVYVDSQYIQPKHVKELRVRTCVTNRYACGFTGRHEGWGCMACIGVSNARENTIVMLSLYKIDRDAATRGVANTGTQRTESFRCPAVLGADVQLHH